MGTAVLALQGAFIEHEQKLEKLGEPFFEIREEADLKRPFDHLILPGGESTVQGRLLRKEGLLDPLRERIGDGMPVLATCAGLILLARNIEDDVEDGTDRSAA
ncbi:MAG: pyridoxal 5'-phosphate synthase glutaminase subunit PdxT, partial [Atopobiaceae bacterium]|nr:pyridoxal 5'-phosphate synthase glutaminase subunit PdxT [Atopobiaceae bacterium]